MLTHSWIINFPDRILERGEEYQAAGLVANLQMTDKCLTATVLGTHPYAVKIMLKGGRPTEMSCTCPYASDGKYCKHMVAVLLEAEEEEAGEDQGSGSCEGHLGPALAEDLAERDTGTVFGVLTGDGDRQPLPARDDRTVPMCPDGESPSLHSLLVNAAHTDIISFLEELAQSDPSLANRIRTRFSPLFTSVDMRKLESEARGIIRRHENCGFIDYREAMDFEIEMSSFIETKCGDLIETGNFDAAFDLSSFAFLLLNSIDIDDDGEISSLSLTCCGVWRDILDKCSATTSDRIREWFESHMTDPTLDFLGDVLTDFYNDEFADEEILRSRLAELDDIIERAADSSTCPAGYSVINNAKPAILERIDLMQRLGENSESIESYRYAHRHFAEIRDQYLQEARSSHDSSKIMQLLREGITANKDYDFYSHTYALQLADLYVTLGDKCREREVLFNDFLSYSLHEPRTFARVKSLCAAEEWPEFRDAMLNAVERDKETYCGLLAAEGLEDRLFGVLCTSDDPGLLNKFGMNAARHHSPEILSMYTSHLLAFVENARTTKSYKYLISTLQRMSDYPGGPELATSLASSWINAYPTRKKLVAALRNFIASNNRA